MPFLVVKPGFVELHRLEVLVALLNRFDAKLELLCILIGFRPRSRLVGVAANLFNCG